MSDCPTSEEIRAYLEDRLCDAARRPVEVHLNKCERCQHRLDKLPDDFAAAVRDVLGAAQIVRPSPGAGSESKSGPLTEPAAPAGYRILRFLGRGNFGEVWLAEYLGPRPRLVALKMLSPRLAPERHIAALQALENDANALGRLRHPNVAQIVAWLHSGSEYYLVLQYVAGGSLAARVDRDGPLRWQDAARYVADVGEGLLAAHRLGIIHRDIKPANILWDAKRDEALLTDFGISARLAGRLDVAGTPTFMAPETFQGQVSPAQDVYSLGATLFSLVTGQVPFYGASIQEILAQSHRGLPDPDPRLQGVPEPLEGIIRDVLAYELGQRPSLSSFLHDLRGELNRLIADEMATSAADRPTAPVNLKLRISRKVGATSYQPVPAAPPRRLNLSRDAKKKKGPPPPVQVSLRTGDTIRLEVSADHAVNLAVFNVGPTGNLNLLYPDEPLETSPHYAPSLKSFYIDDIELSPPAGRERMFAVWSLRPLRLDQLQSLADRNEATVSRSYHATRDMQRMRESLRQLPPKEGGAVVVELDHLP